MASSTPQIMIQGNNPLKIWEPIEIMIGDGTEQGRYRSRIEDFINGGIVISEPAFLEGSTLLRNDMDVVVMITRDDAVYQFTSHIRQTFTSGGRNLILSPPRNIRRVQRRLFCRVETMEELSYALIDPSMDWDDYDENLHWKTTATRDISGGGVLMRLEEPIDLEQLMLLRLNLPEIVEFPEIIVGVCRRVFDQDSLWWAGVEFLVAGRLGRFFSSDETKRLPSAVGQYDSAAQARLVSYTFNKQIDLRNKGLL